MNKSGRDPAKHEKEQETQRPQTPHNDWSKNEQPQAVKTDMGEIPMQQHVADEWHGQILEAVRPGVAGCRHGVTQRNEGIAFENVVGQASRQKNARDMRQQEKGNQPKNGRRRIQKRLASGAVFLKKCHETLLRLASANM